MVSILGCAGGTVGCQSGAEHHERARSTEPARRSAIGLRIANGWGSLLLRNHKINLGERGPQLQVLQLGGVAGTCLWSFTPGTPTWYLPSDAIVCAWHSHAVPTQRRHHLRLALSYAVPTQRRHRLRLAQFHAVPNQRRHRTPGTPTRYTWRAHPLAPIATSPAASTRDRPHRTGTAQRARCTPTFGAGGRGAESRGREIETVPCTWKLPPWLSSNSCLRFEQISLSTQISK